jgi:hypothetical protein
LSFPEVEDIGELLTLRIPGGRNLPSCRSFFLAFWEVENERTKRPSNTSHEANPTTREKAAAVSDDASRAG